MSITINQCKVSFGSSKISTDELKLYLDAANPTSYPGSGNIWYDISGEDNHAYVDPGAEGSGYDDNNFPVYQTTNGGRFYFNGSDGLTVLTDIGSPTEISADFWCYKDDTSATYFFDGRNDGGQWWLSNYSSYNIIIHSALRANDPVSYSSGSNWWGKWIHVVITSDVSGSKLYIDGDEINDARLISSSSLAETLGQYFRIGNRYTSEGKWVGYWSIIRFYFRVITADEVLAHYNSEKTRFGK